MNWYKQLKASTKLEASKIDNSNVVSKEVSKLDSSETKVEGNDKQAVDSPSK